MTRCCFVLVALICFAGSAQAQRPLDRFRDRLAPTPTETLTDAVDVLAELSKIPAKGINPALLADAEGVAIIPHVVKAGFVIAGRGGHGLVLSRGKDGKWGEPIFVNLGGGSVGLQAGVEATDVVLVFRGRKSLDRLLVGKEKLTLGADATIAAGPVGRQASAGTDAKLDAEIVSYSRSRGLFAGVALAGAVVNPDTHTNANFRADTSLEIAKHVESLKAMLTEMSSAKQ